MLTFDWVAKSLVRVFSIYATRNLPFLDSPSSTSIQDSAKQRVANYKTMGVLTCRNFPHYYDFSSHIPPFTLLCLRIVHQMCFILIQLLFVAQARASAGAK